MTSGNERGCNLGVFSLPQQSCTFLIPLWVGQALLSHLLYTYKNGGDRHFFFFVVVEIVHLADVSVCKGESARFALPIRGSGGYNTVTEKKSP